MELFLFLLLHLVDVVAEVKGLSDLKNWLYYCSQPVKKWKENLKFPTHLS